MFLTSEEFKEGGSALLSGSGVFTVPAGVTSISVLGIEQGNTGTTGGNHVLNVGGIGGAGGKGGRRRYINDVSVTPGQQISYSIAAGAFSFGSILTGTSGGVDAGAAGDGYPGGSTGALQTSPTSGGNPGSPISYFDAEASYPFITANQITNIQTALPGSYPGGGGGGGAAGYNVQGSTQGSPGGAGGAGVILVLWPGDSRYFPSQRTPPEIPNEVIFDPRNLPTYMSKFATDGAGTWWGIDISNDPARRGMVYKSTNNGRSFQFLSRPVDAQIYGITYGSGNVFVSRFSAESSGNAFALYRSSSGGQDWSTVIPTLGGVGNIIDLSFRLGRLFLITDRGTSGGTRFASSDNLGDTFAARSLGSSGSVVAFQSKIYHVSDTLMIIIRGNEADVFISRDNGVTTTSQTSVTEFLSAAKLGSVTLAIKNGILYSSTNELVNITAVTAITLSANKYQQFIVPFPDRIVIIDGSTTYQYKDGVYTVISRFPIGVPAVLGATASSNAGIRSASNGVDSIISVVKGVDSANFRSTVYVG
ncbi:hypothetical protein SAMN05216593_10143 [Pseudomonas asturiensis]|uniref:Uncharacterized protein n=2 Tax=Pseudomonas asturiensis TaxID=1190415 RepID=A0A1M7J0X7_9PSED|nr:hypothetical protein SAMN05216593_10143 [Pseudomonas asturiensis]